MTADKRNIAYQKYEEEILPPRIKPRLRKVTIHSIRGVVKKGDTVITIDLGDSVLKLGANDLGAWYKNLRKKTFRSATNK